MLFTWSTPAPVPSVDRNRLKPLRNQWAGTSNDTQRYRLVWFGLGAGLEAVGVGVDDHGIPLMTLELRVDGPLEGIPSLILADHPWSAPRAIPLRRYPAATGNSKPLRV